MSNKHQDQAAGLRQIMTGPQPKVISVLSAVTKHEPKLLTNLAASLSQQDCDVLVMHTAQTAKVSMAQYGIKRLPALTDVAKNKLDIAKSVKDSKLGFLVTKLLSAQPHTSKAYDTANIALNKTVDHLSSLFEVVLIETTLDKDNQLPLRTLNQHEILIQLSCDAESIKQAYTLIKRVYSKLGRRSFGIIVCGANDKQAAKAFRNIAQVAKDHMQVDLEFFGAIPSDERLGRAAKLGRAVIDAFPLTNASTACKHLAQRLSHKHHADTTEPSLVSVI